MKTLAVEDFAGDVGEAFAVAAGPHNVSLQLLTVTALPQGVREGSSFRLEFLGPAEPILPQATYSFEREGRAHDIFIVPIASDAGGTQYEAVFN